MCGILGYSGAFDAALLASGNRAQSHRGPDDSGQYLNEAAGIGLGHVRLSIIDPFCARAPADGSAKMARSCWCSMERSTTSGSCAPSSRHEASVFAEARTRRSCWRCTGR
jgi:hypothetical protein